MFDRSLTDFTVFVGGFRLLFDFLIGLRLAEERLKFRISFNNFYKIFVELIDFVYLRVFRLWFAGARSFG